MDLFNKDGTLNQEALDKRSKLQLEADFAALLADYDQAISARREAKEKGEPTNRAKMQVLAAKIDTLRSLMRARAIEAGERSAGISVSGG